MTLQEWAARWGVPHSALAELAVVPMAQIAPGNKPETHVQARVRLEAARVGGIALFRNNVGVLNDINGRPVRFGLANDSKQINASVKSGDLIGLRTVLITPDRVGTILGQFVSRECKREDWRFDPLDERDAAQARWAAFINARGGDAAIVQGEGSL